VEVSESVERASERFYAAANHVMRGDPAPMIALWSHSADVTYIDPLRGVQRGWEALLAYWERAARMNQGAPDRVNAAADDDLLIRAVGDLAYTVGVERIEVTRDGQVTRMKARATNVFRREAGEWKLIHRHAEPPHQVTAESTSAT
jgi:ketosteroid isomerase-like protein